MSTTARVPPAMHVPPPLLFVATFFVGLAVQGLVPLTVASPAIAKASYGLGVALLAGGVLLALSCVGLFFVIRTTIIPHGRASHLITRGPYRFTRNPMYVSLVLVYLGVAGVLVQVWPLLLLPLPVAFVNAIVIPFEEARLRSVFGSAFDDYRGKARRWI
jgi:protein-S-isoprenylcysteine O-methyltransferase Ste14